MKMKNCMQEVRIQRIKWRKEKYLNKKKMGKQTTDRRSGNNQSTEEMLAIDHTICVYGSGHLLLFALVMH